MQRNYRYLLSPARRNTYIIFTYKSCINLKKTVNEGAWVATITYVEPCGFDAWDQLYAGLLNSQGGECREHKCQLLHRLKCYLSTTKKNPHMGKVESMNCIFISMPSCFIPCPSFHASAWFTWAYRTEAVIQPLHFQPPMFLLVSAVRTSFNRRRPIMLCCGFSGSRPRSCQAGCSLVIITVSIEHVGSWLAPCILQLLKCWGLFDSHS